MRNSVVLAVALTALGACKGKPIPHASGSGADPAAAGSGSGSATMGALVPNKGSDVAPDIVLPHSDGSPPPKSTAAVTADKLRAMGTLQFPGFLRDVRRTTDTYFEVRHKTDSRPRIMASIFVEPCATSAVPCTPMDVAAWTARTEQLKELLTKELKEAPDTQFEVGETTFDGVKAIYTSQLAQKIDKDADGNMVGGFSYAYVLYFNDGMNQIRVVSEYKDDPMATKEDMVKSLPKADLEKVAKAFADVYSHAW